MKKKIALAVLILGAGITLAVYISKNGFKDNSSSTQTADEQNTNSAFYNSEITSSPFDNSETTNSTSISETADSNISTPGGNSEIADYIEVTVSEDKYFYENHVISYDDLIKVLDGLDGNTAVRISDENATLKAYESLTKALEERNILFETAN